MIWIAALMMAALTWQQRRGPLNALYGSDIL